MQPTSEPTGVLRRLLDELPVPLRGAFVGAALAGVVGGVIGLVVGLMAHPPTAWFAVFELGIPAGLLGAVVGLVAASLGWALGRIRRGHRRPAANHPAAAGSS